jgi:hypothetical protein
MVYKLRLFLVKLNFCFSTVALISNIRHDVSLSVYFDVNLAKFSVTPKETIEKQYRNISAETYNQ